MPSSFTRTEKLQMAWLAARAAKQSLAGDRNVDTISDKVTREAERIEKRAAERGAREVAALERRLDDTRNAAAAAKTTMRTSRGKDRATARTEMQEHEKAARRVERELRRFQ